jgi:uncharacterized integral membrane protein (TIGR00698 family)
MLSAYVTRSGGETRSKLTIPWFALWFAAVAAFHSWVRLPAHWVSAAVGADTAILAMAMAALGLTTHRSAVGKAGLKPIALGALLFAWLIAGGTLVNVGMARLLTFR